MRKKWFTILELIMVIWIISILIVTFRDIFNNSNKDYLYAEVCVNKIYWDINNYIYSALTSKWLYVSWSWTIFPKQYTIKIQPSNNEFSLDYKINTWTWTYIQENLDNQAMEEYYCKTNKYTIYLSWDDFNITINKSSIQDQTLPTFTINDGQAEFTKTTAINLCYTGNDCKEIYNFMTDIRTQTISKKKCLLINDQWTNCLERDQ